MLHYFKFRHDLFSPAPAKEVYVKPGVGKGWPQECPPIRAASGFGFDLLANFDVTFIQSRKNWKVETDRVIESDFNYSGSDESEGSPLSQQYAWFWEQGQKIPHVISDNVYELIRNQVKVSSFLFLKTDPNELLYFTDVPNMRRPWHAMTALVDTDWFPASYPWHAVFRVGRGPKENQDYQGGAVVQGHSGASRYVFRAGDVAGALRRFLRAWSTLACDAWASGPRASRRPWHARHHPHLCTPAGKVEIYCDVSHHNAVDEYAKSVY